LIRRDYLKWSSEDKWLLESDGRKFKRKVPSAKAARHKEST
jgi:hypothetical protein